MIIDYSTAYIVNTLDNIFVFVANESEPPAPPIEFGPGGGSFVVGGSARQKLAGGSNVKLTGGRGGRRPIGGNR